MYCDPYEGMNNRFPSSSTKINKQISERIHIFNYYSIHPSVYVPKLYQTQARNWPININSNTKFKILVKLLTKLKFEVINPSIYEIKIKFLLLLNIIDQ